MGLFTDAYWLKNNHKVTYKHFSDYLITLGIACPQYKDMKPNGYYDLKNFMKYFNYSLKLYEEIFGLIGRVWSKWENFYFFSSDKKKINGIYVHGVIDPSGDISLGDRYTHDISKPIGQIAVKEEAAGKLRLFALCDSWTQSLLYPLHKYLFEIIRQIPNDGTFDQEASVRRSIQKALKVEKVYSFDLSAATDRLPISLQSHVLDTITGIKGLGSSWAGLLTSREYIIPMRSRAKYGINSISVEYAVGQPMGAYSSWAMLDITHHWILQYCASRVYNISLFSHDKWVWNEEYEILGDDIDIFNEKIAEEYLKVMNALGVDINLGKSVISNNHSFEFAKRYINRGTDVSGLSWRQFVDYPKDSGAFIGSILQWLDRGLITNFGVFVNMLNRSVKRRDLSNVKALRHMFMPLITILGIYTSKGRMPLSWLAEILVNPNMKGLNLNMEVLLKEGLPYRRIFKYIKEINQKINKLEKIPELLTLLELDPNSTFIKGRYPAIQENVEIVNSLAFIPKRKRAVREWWSRLILPYWSYVAGEDLIRSTQASKEVMKLMNTKSSWPDMKGWDDPDTLASHYVSKVLPQYTKLTVFKSLERKFLFDQDVLKLFDNHQTFNTIGWKILDFYKSVIWKHPLENDLSPILPALLRDKPLQILEEVKEVCGAVPLSSPFYKGERSYSVRLDSEDYLCWTRDYIYEMDRVEVKTPLIDQIEVKLPDKKKPYKELRPMWLISLIKALKGLQLTHLDVSTLSKSSITFYKRPVYNTDLKGGVEDWLARNYSQDVNKQVHNEHNIMDLIDEITKNRGTSKLKSSKLKHRSRNPKHV